MAGRGAKYFLSASVGCFCILEAESVNLSEHRKATAGVMQAGDEVQRERPGLLASSAGASAAFVEKQRQHERMQAAIPPKKIFDTGDDKTATKTDVQNNFDVYGRKGSDRQTPTKPHASTTVQVYRLYRVLHCDNDISMFLQIPAGHHAAQHDILYFTTTSNSNGVPPENFVEQDNAADVYFKVFTLDEEALYKIEEPFDDNVCCKSEAPQPFRESLRFAVSHDAVPRNYPKALFINKRVEPNTILTTKRRSDGSISHHKEFYVATAVEQNPATEHVAIFPSNRDPPYIAYGEDEYENGQSSWSLFRPSRGGTRPEVRSLYFLDYPKRTEAPTYQMKITPSRFQDHPPQDLGLRWCRLGQPPRRRRRDSRPRRLLFAPPCSLGGFAPATSSSLRAC
ncbi:unnamed protein product, partial [Amoebophrya sp. A120]|eukprot:GSA120T00009013001.1